MLPFLVLNLHWLFAIFRNAKAEYLPVNAAFKVADEVLTNAVKGITEDIDNFRYNLALIKLRTLFDSFNEGVDKDTAKSFLTLLHPFCPHITEELWNKIGGNGFISLASWPKADEKKINEKFEKQDEAIKKLIEDINHIVKLVNPATKAFVFVLPNEKVIYDEGLSEIEKKTGLVTKIFAVNDKNKYDPQGKAKKAKPGKPAIYLE